jgi:23S rRNA G2445 N2-methylase RlmL
MAHKKQTGSQTTHFPFTGPFSAAILCDKGCESAVARELELKFKLESTIKNRIIEFTTTHEQLIHITYLTQGGVRIFAQADFETTTFEGSFKLDVLDITKLADSQELAKKLGGQIFMRTNQPVDLKTPKHKLVHIITEDATYFGFDYWHEPLFKREYKMFNSSTALRATVAFALLMIGGYKRGETLLDPFCGSGTIPIEAALFAQNRSPRFYEKEKLPYAPKDIDALDKLKDAGEIYGYDIQTKAVDSTKKNAKIAGVLKSLDLGRAEIDWIDTKFQDKELDLIVTASPLFVSHDMDKVVKLHQQFFTRIPQLLKKKGRIVILTNDALKLRELVPPDYVIEQTVIWMGQEQLDVLKLTRA